MVSMSHLDAEHFPAAILSEALSGSLCSTLLIEPQVRQSERLDPRMTQG